MGDTVSVKAQICLPDSQPSDADSCNNVQLLLSRDDLQNISTDNSSPYLGDFNSGYLGTGRSCSGFLPLRLWVRTSNKNGKLKVNYMGIKNRVSSAFLKVCVLGSVALSSSAFAAETSENGYLQGLIDKIDVAPIITGVVAVAGTVMGVAVVVMGIKKVSRMLNAF
ncbi:hypothetical protein AM420_005763 [Klebsiella pneumoniae]|nr:hypothetical protein [Klebsiella pneumoniae]OKN42794.1 hypothetical protein AM420_005763 [Klebsiella pneumoniae]